MKKTLAASCLAAFGLIQPAMAGDMAIGAKVGTLGAGVEIVSNVVPMLVNARIQLNAYNLNRTITDTQVSYDAKFKLLSFGALADVYPFAGKFRLTGGLYYNGNKLTMTGVPLVGSYTINGATYTAGQVGSLTSTVDFNKIAPYAGIGFGDSISSGSPIGFNFDLGVLYMGQPKTAITATGAAANPALAASIAGEKQKLDDALKNMQFYPVASIGVTFRF
ncbi:MAG: hypothetical protein Q9M22_03235 [Mariprofundaceae bacterium]|nr:hypothetical protein [Mariprofundaceae bacterium]